MAKNINVVLSLQDRFTRKMSLAKYETQKFKVGLEAAKTVSNEFAGVMGKIEQVALIGTATFATGAAALVKESLDSYKELQTVMNDVAGIKRVDTGTKKWKEFTQEVKNAAKAVKGMDYTDAAEVYKYMSLAGWNDEQQRSAAIPILKAARISEDDIKTVADAITDSATALGLTSEQIGQYVDMSVAAQSASNTDILQLHEALIGSGAAMNMLYGDNMDIMDIVRDNMTVIGTLASAGTKGSEGGTVLRSLLTRFVKDGTRREAQVGLEEIGMSMYDDAGHLKQMNEIMSELARRVGALDEQTRNSVLSKIGGQYMNELNIIMNAYNKMTESGVTLADYVSEALENSAGATDAYIEAVTSGWSGKVRELEKDWSNFKYDIGEMLEPYGIEVLDNIINRLPELESFIRDRLPDAIERAKPIAKEFFEEFKSFLEFIKGNWKTISGTVGGAYLGMGAFRLGTAGMQAYSDIKGLELLFGKMNDAKTKALEPKKSKAPKKPKWLSASSIDKLDVGVFESLGTRPLGDGVYASVGRAASGSKTPQVSLNSLEKIKKAYPKIDADDLKGLNRAFNEALGEFAENEAAGGIAAILGNAGAAGAALTGKAGAAGGATVGGFAAAVGIIAAAAAALALAWKNSDMFRESIGKVIDKAEKFASILNVGKKFEKIKPVLEDLKPVVDDFFGLMGDMLGLMLELSPILSPIGSMFMDLLEPLGDSVWSIFCAILGSTADILGVFVGWLRDGLSSLKELIDYINTYTAPSREILQKSLVEPMAAFLGSVSDAYDKYIALKKEINASKTANEHYNKMTGMYGTVDDLQFEDSGSIYKNRYTYSDEETENTGTGYKNALGTNYWKGGFTHINENGGEIVDLPRGSRIYPADKSKKMLGGGSSPTVIISIENYYGEDERYIDRMGNEVAKRLAPLMN